MRESIGNTWTFGLVLTFVLLFSAFLSVAINYSKVFKVKNEMISILEKYEGYTETSREIINKYLTYTGYQGRGTCPSGYDGESSLSNSGPYFTKTKKNAVYCIKKTEIDSKNNLYQIDVILFFNFNLPVLGQLGSFNIKGQTKDIKIVD